MDIKNIYYSITILVLSTIIAFFFGRIFKKADKVKPIYILLIGAFLAVFSIMIELDYSPEQHGEKSTLFFALYHTMQVMLLGFDASVLHDVVSMESEYAGLIYPYTSFLFFLTPVYTFGFILSFFERVSAYIIYLIKFSSRVFIISELSEKTIILAKSIRKKYPWSTICFMDIVPENKNTNLLKEAKENHSLLFEKKITDVGLMFHTKRSRAVFLLAEDDETQNINKSLKIIDKFKNRENTELYSFSTSKEGGLLFDSVDKGKMKVRRINENRSFVYSLIHNNLITKQYTKNADKKLISPLIIGFGGYGKELAKAYLWCSQLPGYELKLNIIDSSESAESEFCAECPEIMKLNNNSKAKEARYSIDFHCGIDVKSSEFADTVSNLSDTSVVYISLGTDELTIETAIQTRILLERIGIFPTIRAVIYSKEKCDAIKKYGLTNYRGDDYEIEIIGGIESRYDYDTIINEELESKALSYHLKYALDGTEKTEAEKQAKIKASIEDFNKIEYFRASSEASAIHEKYRIRENLPVDISTVYEHLRWSQYMRCEGYVYSGSPDNSTRNDRAKLHHNLHPQNLLTEEDVKKDSRMVAD